VRVDDLQYVVRWHGQPEIFLAQYRHDLMPHEDRIGQSAWDYGTVIIIVIAALAVSPGNARVYGKELLSKRVNIVLAANSVRPVR
jgi:hypothetical protein